MWSPERCLRTAARSGFKFVTDAIALAAATALNECPSDGSNDSQATACATIVARQTARSIELRALRILHLLYGNSNKRAEGVAPSTRGYKQPSLYGCRTPGIQSTPFMTKRINAPHAGVSLADNLVHRRRSSDNLARVRLRKASSRAAQHWHGLSRSRIRSGTERLRTSAS